MSFGRTPRQQFQVPIIEVATSQRRLNAWITLGVFGVVVLALIDGLTFLNFSALEFGSGETYSASFDWIVIILQIIKYPQLILSVFAIAQSRISYSVLLLTITLVVTIITIVYDVFLLIVLLVELTSCNSGYCFREAGDNNGTPGTITLQFYIQLFAVVASIVARLAEVVAVVFIQRRIRIRNTAVLENVASNRSPMNPLAGVASVRSVTAVASELTGANSSSEPMLVESNSNAPTKMWGLRFFKDDGQTEIDPPQHLNIDSLVVHKKKKHGQISSLTAPIFSFLEEDSDSGESDSEGGKFD